MLKALACSLLTVSALVVSGVACAEEPKASAPVPLSDIELDKVAAGEVSRVMVLSNPGNASQFAVHRNGIVVMNPPELPNTGSTFGVVTIINPGHPATDANPFGMVHCIARNCAGF